MDFQHLKVEAFSQAPANEVIVVMNRLLYPDPKPRVPRPVDKAFSHFHVVFQHCPKAQVGATRMSQVDVGHRLGAVAKTYLSWELELARGFETFNIWVVLLKWF